VLTVLRRLTDLLRPGRGAPPGPPRKILLIKMTEQGATVLAYRSIARAVEIVGRENVYFWAFAENRFILDLLGLIPPENVFAVRNTGPFTFARDTISSIFRIRKLGIDATVDMEFFARAPAVLAFLTGASRRVGLHRFSADAPYRGDLMTHRVQYNPHLHTALFYYMLVETLLGNPADIPMLKQPTPQPFDGAPPHFVPTPEQTAAVQTILDREAGRVVPRPIALLNPNASDMLPLRKWPTDRFIDLGRLLLSEFPDLTIAITGAPGERVSADDVARAIDPDRRRAISLAGRTTLQQLFVLYTMADLLVTNDSGPGHFSSMTDLDTLVLFGPETPALYGPLGPRSHFLYKHLACSPCVNALNHRFSPCKNNVCMQIITVAEVFQRVSELLARRSRPQTAPTTPAARESETVSPPT